MKVAELTLGLPCLYRGPSAPGEACAVLITTERVHLSGTSSTPAADRRVALVRSTAPLGSRRGGGVGYLALVCASSWWTIEFLAAVHDLIRDRETEPTDAESVDQLVPAAPLLADLVRHVDAVRDELKTALYVGSDVPLSWLEAVKPAGLLGPIAAGGPGAPTIALVQPRELHGSWLAHAWRRCRRLPLVSPAEQEARDARLVLQRDVARRLASVLPADEMSTVRLDRDGSFTLSLEAVDLLLGARS